MMCASPGKWQRDQPVKTVCLFELELGVRVGEGLRLVLDKADERLPVALAHVGAHLGCGEQHVWRR